MFLKPVLPPYDPLEWEKKPFPERAAMVCRAWALQGYGTPIAIYLVYVLKIALYVGGWLLFCRTTPGMGHLDDIGSWWLRPVAFEKAIVWSVLFELLGLGCGSGPLTGRYVPPIGGALYFLRPGTIKLPVLRGVPLVGGERRTWLDAALYAAFVALAVAALMSPTPGRPLWIALAVLLIVLGLLDRTLFLAARGEHYWTLILIFALTTNFIPGAKGVGAALWLWAGISKLNRHFPAVVCVMTSNSPFVRSTWFKKRMYRRYPDDLSPSALATWMAHVGTALELGVPVVLLSGHGGSITIAGLVMMLLLHGFITSNVPMGVPLEWNVMVVYGGFFLFWKHAAVSLLSVTWPVAVVLVVMCVGVPLLGNLLPSRVPFLLSMRYYAGNWAYSVWLFRDKSYEKLARLKKSSPWIYDQLGLLYDRSTSVGIVGKVMAFRLMHLHGRALPGLIPKTVDDLAAYEWLDGEIVAGLALGWNFGEGHLHREELLQALQHQCGFEEGELRVIMVESQPLFQSTLHYRIHDAARGLLEHGHVDVNELCQQQPWGGSAGTASPVH